MKGKITIGMRGKRARLCELIANVRLPSGVQP